MVLCQCVSHLIVMVTNSYGETETNSIHHARNVGGLQGLCSSTRATLAIQADESSSCHPPNLDDIPVGMLALYKEGVSWPSSDHFSILVEILFLEVEACRIWVDS